MFPNVRRTQGPPSAPWEAVARTPKDPIRAQPLFDAGTKFQTQHTYGLHRQCPTFTLGTQIHGVHVGRTFGPGGSERRALALNGQNTGLLKVDPSLVLRHKFAAPYVGA